MRSSSRWIAFAVTAAWVWSAHPCSAQPTQATAAEKATAEALFDDALRLMHAGQFAEACPKFEVSQRIEAAVGTLLYLGECYEKTGRTASGWATFREAASLAEAAGQLDRMKTARARAARLEPDLAWLTIQISKEALAVPGLQVRRAATPMQVDLSGVAVPVDPGEIAVEASAPGHATYATSVSVAARGRAVVSIAGLALIPTSEVQTAPLPPDQPASSSFPFPASLTPPVTPPVVNNEASPHSSIIPFVVGGVGLVGLGVGSYFGLKAISNANDARDVCPDGICNEKRGATLADDARTAAKVSNVAFVVGTAAVAAGVVLYFTLPGKPAQVGLSPVFDRDSAGLSLRGRL